MNDIVRKKHTVQDGERKLCYIERATRDIGCLSLEPHSLAAGGVLFF